MKNKLLALLGFILLSTPRVATAAQSGDFTYELNLPPYLGVTITRYTGLGGMVTIPDEIDGYSVAFIEDQAFYDSRLTSVTIPDGVFGIGDGAFYFCTSLNNITIPASVTSIGSHAFYSCRTLASITIPNSVTSIGEAAFGNCWTLAKITIPNSITIIGDAAFYSCTNLTSISIPHSVTGIGMSAFEACTSLMGVYFHGDVPEVVGPWVFFKDNNATIYYLPGASGWGTTFAGRPAVLWNPLVQTGDASFGVRTNRFGFTITGTADIPIVVEACTNLAHANWVPLQSLNLTNGAFYFSDPQWTNYPTRFYRFRSP
jgi:BspA type Leucine rich repeat region (6 copies)